MKINWKVRLRNPIFWITMVPMVLSAVYEILAWAGVTPAIPEGSVLRILQLIVKILGMLGIINDPTVKGLLDSLRAMTYTTPFADGEEAIHDEH